MHTELIFSGGVYLNKHELDEGEIVDKHTHAFTHTSIVAKGAVIVHIAGVPMLATAGDTIEIVAGTAHRVEALTAATWICAHSEEPGEINATQT